MRVFELNLRMRPAHPVDPPRFEQEAASVCVCVVSNELYYEIKVRFRLDMRGEGGLPTTTTGGTVWR